MYDRLKAHGAEIMEKGITNVSIDDIRQIVVDTASNSEGETVLIAEESPEIANGVRSWAAFLASTFSSAQKLLDTDEFCALLVTGMVQLAAVAFEAGYRVGKMRGPITEGEVQKLFERKE